MKKELFNLIILFIIFSLFLINLVYAQNISGNFGNIKEKSNQILEKEVQVPDNLQLLTKFLFGLKSSDKVDLETIVILFALLIILLPLIHEGIGLFLKGMKGWLASIIIFLIAASTGITFEITKFFLSINNFFGLFKEYHMVRFIIALIILALIYYATSLFIKVIKIRTNREQLEATGSDISLAAKIARMWARY